MAFCRVSPDYPEMEDGNEGTTSYNQGYDRAGRIAEILAFFNSNKVL